MSRQLSSVLSEYYKKYGEQGQELEAEIQRLLSKGYKIDDAVKTAMSNLGFEQQFINDIENLQIDSVGLGIGRDISSIAGMTAFREALNRPWSMDGIPLSKRLHGATQEMRATIIDTISKQVKLNASAMQIANKLYDGYGYGAVIKQQDIAKYMKDIANFARRSNLTVGDSAELLKYLRQAQNKISNLAQHGAPNRALKASYQQIVEAIRKGSEKALNNAIKVAIEEKSRYVAERIARTEGARAWFDGFIAEHNNDELVVAYKWTLNSRHPVFDICDMYAKADMFGLGAGIYPKNKIPRLPAHPHCLCYLTPIYYGEIDLSKMNDRVNIAGKEWLDKLTDEQRKDILGVIGRDSFDRGGKWQNYMRGWHGLHDPVSRIDIGLLDNKLLPNYKNAVIPEGKVFGYALNPDSEKGKHKAIVFQSALGYNLENGKELIDNILNNLGNFERDTLRSDKFGERFNVAMELTGPNGKTANVVTGWIIDYDKDYPRLTTLFVDAKKEAVRYGR